MLIINDNGFYTTPLLLLVCILVLLIIHIGMCVYLYLTHKKYPKANGKIWFVINLFIPLLGVLGYIINKSIVKNSIIEEN